MSEFELEPPFVQGRKRKAKAPKEPKPTDPAVKRCIDFWHDSYVLRLNRVLYDGRRTYGMAYVAGEEIDKVKMVLPDPRQFGRLGKELKPLLASWGEQAVRSIIAEFFSARDPGITRQWRVQDFLANVQLLRQQVVLKAAGGRRASVRNEDAIERATRGERD